MKNYGKKIIQLNSFADIRNQILHENFIKVTEILKNHDIKINVHSLNLKK